MGGKSDASKSEIGKLLFRWNRVSKPDRRSAPKRATVRSLPGLGRSVVPTKTRTLCAGGSPHLIGICVLVLSAVALLTAIGGVLSPAAMASEACTNTWVGPNAGSWWEPSNWSTGTVPTDEDTVCIEGKIVEIPALEEEANKESYYPAATAKTIRVTEGLLVDAVNPTRTFDLELKTHGEELIRDATLEVTEIAAGEGTIVLAEGVSTIDLEDAAAEYQNLVGSVVAKQGGRIIGDGTINVREKFNWTSAPLVAGPASQSAATTASSWSAALDSVRPGSLTPLSPVTAESVSGENITLKLEKNATGELNKANLKCSIEMPAATVENEGTLTLATGEWTLVEGGGFTNRGTFNDDSETQCGESRGEINISAESDEKAGEPHITNYGVWQKTAGTGNTIVAVKFWDEGAIDEQPGHGQIEFIEPYIKVPASVGYGEKNEAEPERLVPTCGDPVNCLTGNFTETQSDIEVAGRGVGLDLTRYYNGFAAAAAESGAFGYGWTSSFSEHLKLDEATHTATLIQDNGSTVTFTEEGGAWKAPRTQDILTGSAESGSR